MREIARRSLLAGISAIPAATVADVLPLPVLAHPAGPDAVLIAQASQVTRLSRLHDQAHVRLARKADAVIDIRGPRPSAPDTCGLTEIAEHDVDPASDIERRFTMTFRRPTASLQAAQRRHVEADAAWLAEGERLGREAGTNAAGLLCDTLFDRLQDATDALTAMPAVGPAGMAAKADAFLALMQTRHGAEEWEIDLGRSLARDAARIGTGAA